MPRRPEDHSGGNLGATDRRTAHYDNGNFEGKQIASVSPAELEYLRTTAGSHVGSERPRTDPHRRRPTPSPTPPRRSYRS